MKTLIAVVAAIMLLCLGGLAQADVLNMGSGLTSLQTVDVGNAGNLADEDTGKGAVAYTYAIGKYEVTAAQYTEFLNKVAARDDHNLYSPSMSRSTDWYGCAIERTGESGSYTYSVSPDYANAPVNFVCFWDACRFANWLHNGQPSGIQVAGTTEDGVYFLNGVTNPINVSVTRSFSAIWGVPTQNEWYKAAYYDPATSSYFEYATKSNTLPGRDISEATNPGNNANYWPDGASGPWNDPNLNGRTLVGEFQLSVSPYGTFDQNGNVTEWNEYVNQTNRGRYGGFFARNETEMTKFTTVFQEVATYEGYDMGFRVMHYTKPSTLSGHVNLLDYNFGPDCAVAVTIKMIQNNVAVRTENKILDASGNYHLDNVVPGSYQVSFKVASFLENIQGTTAAPIVVPADTDAVLDVDLVNGDVDGSNNVNSTDVSTVIKGLN